MKRSIRGTMWLIATRIGGPALLIIVLLIVILFFWS